MMGSSSLVLVGMMGSGKSSVGACLAKLLGYDFVDMDVWIESQAKCTIADIFVNEGEEKFRQLESRALVTLLDACLQKPNPSLRVISTGGGIVTRSDNRARLKNKTIVVIYLKASVDLLQSRLQGVDYRPLINQYSDKLLLNQRLCQLLEQRQFLYGQVADLVVECSKQKDVQSTARQIIDELILSKRLRQ